MSELERPARPRSTAWPAERAGRDGFLDDVARSLAVPMPRRRAVRIIAVTVAATAFPGWRAVRAPAAALETCTRERPWSCSCPSAAGLKFQLCCFPEQECKCRSFQAECDNTCSSGLCKPYPRPGYPVPKGPGVCCPPGTRCAANHSTSACCGTDQKVAKGGGACKCPTGTTTCGLTNCCFKGETCINTECCANDQVINGACWPSSSVAKGSPNGAAFCCPQNTVAVAGGNACCPTAIRDCCDTAMETPPLPRPGYAHICVSGGYTIYTH